MDCLARPTRIEVAPEVAPTLADKTIVGDHLLMVLALMAASLIDSPPLEAMTKKIAVTVAGRIVVLWLLKVFVCARTRVPKCPSQPRLPSLARRRIYGRVVLSAACARLRLGLCFRELDLQRESKMKSLIWVAVICLVAPNAARAQGSTANAVTATGQRILARYAKILVAAAEEMPPDKYGYRPTPQEMTFGKSIEHIAEVNNFSCSKFSDIPMPERPKVSENDPKDKLVSALKASFDYCTQALAKLDDSKMGDAITFFGGRPATRAAAVFELTDDLSDHYGALAVYLRLNGLLPPTAQ